MPPRNTILLHSTHHTDPAPSNSLPLEVKPQTLCHLANKLKVYCEQANRRIYLIWNSNRQHAAR